jgi:hypothetical protein
MTIAGDWGSLLVIPTVNCVSRLIKGLDIMCGGGERANTASSNTGRKAPRCAAAYRRISYRQETVHQIRPLI